MRYKLNIYLVKYTSDVFECVYFIVGSIHYVASIDKLVSHLKELTDQVKVKVNSKEERLSQLLKHCTKVISEFEEKTGEMILLLQTTRDESVNGHHNSFHEFS